MSRTNLEFIDQFLVEMKSIIDKLDRTKIDQIIEAMFETWKTGKRMYLMGNGGSA